MEDPTSSWWHAIISGERELQDAAITPAPTPASTTPMPTSQPGNGSLWQMIYVGVVLLVMFAALITDKIGSDMVMLAALTACMAGQIISIEEGVAGFANTAVLTVMILFVVAAGIELTGGLDWYMAKLLGRPKSVAAAQLRLMLPIAFISAFLNNTPVVVVMIPIVQKWARNCKMAVGQLLIPLSFASILGGTCTLIGTSTNLVVYGLLETAYPGQYTIGLFSLGQYGVPIAILGSAYIILFSPCTLPGGVRKKKDRDIPMDDGNILLGALMTQWSPAVGRTVKRSGLRDTGGIYLVSVYRASTGNIHRAVGPDFVLNVGDILYFTGMVEGFRTFCEENGLEIITKDTEAAIHAEANIQGTARTTNVLAQDASANIAAADALSSRGAAGRVTFADSVKDRPKLSLGPHSGKMIIDVDVEFTSKRRLSMLGPKTDKLQLITKMTDAIRGYDQDLDDEIFTGPPKIVVAVESQSLEDVVIVGINATDRPGLLLSISKGLHSVGLQLHHTEAAVIRNRSISVWRCEFIDEDHVAKPKHHRDPEDIEEGIRRLLEKEVGAGPEKTGGMPVIRVQVTKKSSLIGVCLADVNFQGRYKAWILAVSKADGSSTEIIREVVFAANDILVLEAMEDSPLLVRPPPDFYTESGTSTGYSAGGFIKALTPKVKDSTSLFQTVASKFHKGSSTDLEALEANEEEEEDGLTVSYICDTNQMMCNAWRDLRVLFQEKEEDDNVGNGSREYMNARKVTPKSVHIGKTVSECGLDKLTGLFLISVERPLSEEDAKTVPDRKTFKASVFADSANSFHSGLHAVNDSISGSLISSPSFSGRARAVAPEDPLKAGDIIWFAGSAEAIVELRKVPGLESPQKEVLEGVNENKFDRRLVQAVVAKQGPLVGLTPIEFDFMRKYGAVVIAVHRHGKRIQDYPGNIKLQSGDVLLLEAGPTFIAKNADNQRSFALINEVKNSKPPRLDKLKWALLITIIMLALTTIGEFIPALSDKNISNLFVLGLIASIIMVSTGILSQQECRDAVNWEVYITIASAFGIGTALTASGLANAIATFLVAIGTGIGIGPAGVFGAVYFATFLISNVVTNNAAAALMFPIAMQAAHDFQPQIDKQLMAYCLMLAASASFMSPFGYQTNLLVYGPGGYKVRDFLKIGTPMQLILWIFTTLILTNPSGLWWLSWVGTFIAFILVLAFLVFPAAAKDLVSKMKVGGTKKPEGSDD
ncbi:hypothetical protein ACHAWC_006139 [Mediolabrus comicus]